MNFKLKLPKIRIFKRKYGFSKRQYTRIMRSTMIISDLREINEKCGDNPKDSTLIQKLISNLDSLMNKYLLNKEEK